MSKIHDILTKYWGFEEFRPLQEDIINSVLSGDDTLALLPTGGGKSICYQVPAIAQEGICLVISPLIALMKDQVNNLNSRGIKAVSVYSGLSSREIDVLLDNCIYGNIKLLYLSPERLHSEIVIARLAKMNINLIAVDEAHCISECNGYASPRDTKPLTYRKKKKMAKEVASKSLFRGEVAYKYKLHRYDRKTNDRKAQRLLKKELKREKTNY